MEPLVSVVIPTFNQAEFLVEALASLKAQDYQNWEAIVVNNNSTDSTKAVLEAEQDPRIRAFDFAKKGCIAAVRNYGIKRAKGELLAFLDSDDRWHPKKLSECLEYFEEGADLVCHSEYLFHHGAYADKWVQHYGPLEGARFEALMIRGNCLSTSAVILKKSLLLSCGFFSEDLRINTAEDYELWLRLAKKGAKIAFCEQPLGEYRLHPQSASANRWRNALASFYVMKKHERHWIKRAWKTRALYAIRLLRVMFFIQRGAFRDLGLRKSLGIWA